MTLKKLKDLLTKATNYLYPNLNPEFGDREGKRLISFIETNGLFEELLKQVNKDLQWQDLTESKTIQYFIDVPRHITPEEIVPSITILKLDSEETPVVKITYERNIFF